MNSKEKLLLSSPADLMAKHPYLESFFGNQAIKIKYDDRQPLQQILVDIEENVVEDTAFDAKHFID